MIFDIIFIIHEVQLITVNRIIFEWQQQYGTRNHHHESRDFP